MKLSELKKQIEDAITEILGESEAYKVTGASGKDDLESFANAAAANAFKAANPNIKKIEKLEETEDEDDEFDTLDDTASDKESNKSAKEEEKKNKKINKKRDEIISAYKKIAGDIKAKAKAANSGDKEAKAWILKHQDTIKAYNKLKN